MDVFRISTFLLFFALLVSACKNAPEGEEVQVKEATEERNPTSNSQSADVATLRVDSKASQIWWEGTKVGGGHEGTLKIKKGVLQVSKGRIVGGEFAIDMNSIENTDQEGDDKRDLENHLRSGDFFNVEEFPVATFSISKVEPLTGREDANYLVSGNLTIKGITKSISIPAQVMFAENSVEVVTPKFTIDRTQWDVNYGSGIIGTAKDRIIHDQIGLRIKLTANL